MIATIRNIPEDLWQDFKIICVKEKKSLNTKLIELVQEYVKKKK